MVPNLTKSEKLFETSCLGRMALYYFVGASVAMVVTKSKTLAYTRKLFECVIIRVMVFSNFEI